MKLTEHYLTANDCYRAGRTITPKGVMVHATGVAQPNVDVFLTTWDRPDFAACVHAFVHRDGVVQTLPWNHRGWHAGSGKQGSANNTHISFEICEPAGHTYNGGTMVGYDRTKNQDYFAAVYQNAVELTAYLCVMYDLDPLADGVVLCHSEGYRRGLASNHADVEHWFPKHGKTMDDFRADVAKEMKGERDMTREEVTALVSEAVAAAVPAAVEKAMEAALPPVYRTLEEVPAWGRGAVERLVTRGALRGNERGELNLSADLLRTLVILDRLSKN